MIHQVADVPFGGTPDAGGLSLRVGWMKGVGVGYDVIVPGAGARPGRAT